MFMYKLFWNRGVHSVGVPAKCLVLKFVSYIDLDMPNFLVETQSSTEINLY